MWNFGTFAGCALVNCSLLHTDRKKLEQGTTVIDELVTCSEESVLNKNLSSWVCSWRQRKENLLNFSQHSFCISGSELKLRQDIIFGLLIVKKRANCTFFSYVIDRWNEGGRYTAKILYRKLYKKIFPERKLRGLSPNFYMHIYLWAIYTFQRSVCLFRCRKIGGPILGINKSVTNVWKCKWKLGTRPRSLISVNT